MLLAITPKLAREATALVVGGRLFAECPQCGRPQSVKQPQSYPVDFVCPCGQAFTVKRKEG